jgi:hypothetical protein
MQGKRFTALALSALVLTTLLVVTAASMARDGRAFDPSRSDVIFDSVPVGETSAPQTVTVRNGGDSPLRFEDLRLSGPHPHDFVFSDDCAKRTLAADESCRVHIRFRPTKEGTRVAHLRFDQDGSGSCANWITLAGSGPAQPSATAARCDKNEPAPQSAVTPPAPAAPPAAVVAQPGTNATVLSSGAIGLPARSCRSRRAFRIHINPPRGMRFVQVTVKLNRRSVKVIRGRNITADVSLRGLPRGRFALHVLAQTASGRILERTRHYVTCVRDRSE